ncbi:MFS transporter [Ligilactobacillus salivarius]|uniref:MFS transporter n=1 Tax=Ligilactobacillus salivarius TaxID=1624 RepID=UPI00136C8F23|nr:MFS transporter [Ligilactobacillus salivarius]MYY52893.1 MFS transporter [Ligilactobacillus salivarius]
MGDKRSNLFQLLKAGTTTIINALGAAIFTYALSLKLLEITGSALGYGVNIFIGPIIGLILSPIISKVVDKYPRKNVAIVAEIALVICLAIFLIIYPLTVKTNLLVVSVVFVSISNICARFFSISYLSSTPDIVSKDYLQKLNAIQTTGVAIAGIAALPLAGYIYGKITFEYIILIEIITEILTIFLTVITKFRAHRNEEKAHETGKKLIEILRGNMELTRLTMIAMLLNLAVTSLTIGVPYVVIHVLKYSSVVSGDIQSLYSIGVVLGGAVIAAINIKNITRFIIRLYSSFAVALLILGISLSFFKHETLIIFIVFELILGISTALSDPPLFTYVQEVIPKENLGKVMTFLYTLAQLLTPVGVLIYSTLFAKIDYPTVFLISGIVVNIIVIVVLLFLEKKSKNLA